MLPLLFSDETPPGLLCPTLGPQAMSHADLLERVQKAMETSEGWSNSPMKTAESRGCSARRREGSEETSEHLPVPMGPTRRLLYKGMS